MPSTTTRLDRTTRALIDQARTLQATTELWSLDDVCTAIGVDRDNRKARWQMRTALTNYAVSGETTWPPTHAIRTQRTPDSGPGLRWWPPHVSVPPPPEVPDPHDPLFLSGAVYKWAMTVGRMTLDGQPITPRGGAGEIPRSPSGGPLPEIDLDLWHQLVSDTMLDDIDAISRESGISLPSLYHCYRAARGLRSGAIPWPPTQDDARRSHGETRSALVTHWPATPTALPPPQGVRHPGGVIERHPDVRHEAYNRAVPRAVWLWERGVWRRWAMITGRLTVDGQPVAQPQPRN